MSMEVGYYIKSSTAQDRLHPEIRGGNELNKKDTDISFRTKVFDYCEFSSDLCLYCLLKSAGMKSFDIIVSRS